jgi:hypothetical protein
MGKKWKIWKDNFKVLRMRVRFLYHVPSAAQLIETEEETDYECKEEINKQARKYTHSVIILSCLPEWLGISRLKIPRAEFSRWGFTSAHVGFHVKLPLLLFDFNQNWNMFTTLV